VASSTAYPSSSYCLRHPHTHQMSALLSHSLYPRLACSGVLGVVHARDAIREGIARVAMTPSAPGDRAGRTWAVQCLLGRLVCQVTHPDASPGCGATASPKCRSSPNMSLLQGHSHHACSPALRAHRLSRKIGVWGWRSQVFLPRPRKDRTPHPSSSCSLEPPQPRPLGEQSSTSHVVTEQHGPRPSQRGHVPRVCAASHQTTRV